MHACQTTFALVPASVRYGRLPICFNLQRLLLSNRFIVGGVRIPIGAILLRAQPNTVIMVRRKLDVSWRMAPG